MDQRPEYVPGVISDPGYVRIFDTTLRDGEQSPGATLTSSEKRGAGVRRAPRRFSEIARAPEAPRPLEPGEAARIFTGAPVPAGADAVVRQEDTERDDAHVRVLVSVPAGEHVREAGEDVRDGERVLEPGTRIGPAEIGFLASLGRTSATTASLRSRCAAAATSASGGRPTACA